MPRSPRSHFVDFLARSYCIAVRYMKERRQMEHEMDARLTAAWSEFTDAAVEAVQKIQAEAYREDPAEWGPQSAEASERIGRVVGASPNFNPGSPLRAVDKNRNS